MHYAMPVKNILSDALQYAKQTEKAASAHKTAKDYKGERAGAEFLSGFKKDDRLVPVITLVIQFNDKEWDAPCSLHEMFQIQDPELLQLIPDYKINLISPHAVLDEDFSRFHSNLGGILSFIKCHKDPDKLQEVLNQNSHFRSFGRDEVNVLNACVNAGLSMDTGEVIFDVCEAIQIMRDRSKEEGRIEGKIEGKMETAANMKKKGYPDTVIADVLEVGLDIVSQWLASGTVED